MRSFGGVLFGLRRSYGKRTAIVCGRVRECDDPLLLHWLSAGVGAGVRMGYPLGGSRFVSREGGSCSHWPVVYSMVREMTGTVDDLHVLRAMLADAPTELLVEELKRRGYACVHSMPFDLAAEIKEEMDDARRGNPFNL